MDFHIFNSTDGQLFDKTNIGTEGYQGQWNVPYGDTFEFLVELSSGDQTAYHITLTSAGTNNQQQGGGFDALPIVVAVIFLFVWLISVLLIDRMRGQPPLPSPPEQPPPPPPS